MDHGAFTPEELGYVAGMIDGEGSIWISKKRNRYATPSPYYYSPLLSIGNNNREALERCRRVIGGTIGHTKPHLKNWVLVTTANPMRKFLPLLIPLLTIKKERAILLRRFLELQSTSTPHILPKVREERETIVAEITRLNNS